MNFPVYSQLAGNSNPETGSLETASSTGESGPGANAGEVA